RLSRWSLQRRARWSNDDWRSWARGPTPPVPQRRRARESPPAGRRSRPVATRGGAGDRESSMPSCAARPSGPAGGDGRATPSAVACPADGAFLGAEVTADDEGVGADLLGRA